MATNHTARTEPLIRPFRLVAWSGEGLFLWSFAMSRSYSKLALLAWGFERHGVGTVFGYGEEGFVGSWVIRTSRDVAGLPDDLLYSWIA